MAFETPPCKGCEDRHTACHDHCMKYAQWKEKRQKVTAAEKDYNRKRREDFLHSEECRSPKKKCVIGKTYGRE